VVVVEGPSTVFVSDAKIEVPVGTASIYVSWHARAYAYNETLTEVERGMVKIYVPVRRVLLRLIVPSNRNLPKICFLS
jgi:hypothetical protein